MSRRIAEKTRALLFALAVWSFTGMGVGAEEISVGDLHLRRDETGRLVALAQDEENPRWTFPDDGLDFSSSGPIVRQDQTSVWYGWGHYLLALDVQTGDVVERLPLCDPANRITSKGGQLTVELGGGQRPYAVVYKQGRFEPRMVSTLSVQMVKEAIQIAPDRFRFEDWTVMPLDSESPIDILLERYQAAIRHDPTNPWLLVLRGILLTKQGSEEEAEASWQTALQHPLADSAQLLLMGVAFEDLQHEELADQAYKASYAAYIQEGFEPELANSLLSPVLLMRKVAGRLLKEGRTDRAIALIEHARRFAPFVEGDYYFNLSYAWWLERGHRANQADTARAWNRQPGIRYAGSFGLPPHTETQLDLLLIHGTLVPSGVLLFSLACWFRRYRSYRKALHQMRSRIKQLTFWQRWWLRLAARRPFLRYEMSWLVVGAISSLCLAAVLSGVIAVGKLAASEIVWGSHMGHPRMVDDFKRRLEARPSLAAEFTYAYACQLGGQFDEAKRHYEALSQKPSFRARALNNLAVLEATQGRSDSAHDGLEQAYRHDPQLPEALYNLWLVTHDDAWLGKALEEDRQLLGRQQAYRRQQLMIAPVKPGERLEAILGIKHWSAYTEAGRRAVAVIFAVLFWMMMGILVSARTAERANLWRQQGLKLPDPIPDSPTRMSIWHALIPGSFQALSGQALVGAVLFGLMLFGLIQQLLFWRFGSPGIFTALSIPVMEKLIDFSEPVKAVLRHEDALWRTLDIGSLWLLIGCFVLNLLWMRHNASLKTAERTMPTRTSSHG